MFILSNLAQSSDGGGGIDLGVVVLGFFPLISNFTEVFDYVSWVNFLLSMFFIAEVHKVSRPENEQLRNDNKRQIGKLLGSEIYILCSSIERTFEMCSE